jgi:trk system potassium uptake protein TrkA
MRVSKGSLAAGHQVREVSWPEGCVLVAQMKGLHTEVPGPDNLIEAGDLLYAMVSAKARKGFIKLLD